MCRVSEDYRSGGSVSIHQAFSLGRGWGGGCCRRGGRAVEPGIMAVKVPDDAVEGNCPPDFAPSVEATEHITSM